MFDNPNHDRPVKYFSEKINYFIESFMAYIDNELNHKTAYGIFIQKISVLFYVFNLYLIQSRREFLH